ncbi:MAG: transporter substrate-binding domain-containing protein [Pseudomonadota bacterium]
MTCCGIGLRALNFVRRVMVATLGLGAAAAAFAQQPQPLRYGVFESMGYPFFVAGSAGTSHTGLLIELGEAIARQLNMGLVAVPLPRRRAEPGLIQGQIEMLCYFSPTWSEHPDKLAWSSAMLPQVERVVAPKGGRMGNAPNWEFEGKRVALQLGYHYPDLQRLVDRGKAVRVDQSKVALQFRSLEIKMADLLITSEGEIEGYFNDNPNARSEFDVSRTAFSVTPTHCAIGRHSRLSVAEIDKAIARLQSSGDMDRMAKRYGMSAR